MSNNNELYKISNELYEEKESNSIALNLLSAMGQGGYNDWGTLIEKMKAWKIDSDDLVDYVEINQGDLNIHLLYDGLYYLHVDDIKNIIKEICEDISEDEKIVDCKENLLEQYEVEVYVNCLATTYDNSYELWIADNREDLLENYKEDLIDFLIDEEILVIDKEDEKEAKKYLSNLLDKYQQD